MKINVKCDPGNLPTYGTDGSAGLDLKAPCDVDLYSDGLTIIDTGVCVEIPEGYFGMLSGRSVLNKNSIETKVGIIDSDYRGSIKVILVNRGMFAFIGVKKGDRIAQLIIMPCVKAELIPVEALTDSDRGEGGFGSTGA